MRKLIFIFGPSGSGKDTLLKQIILDLDFEFPPSLTTREKRPNEKQGVYKFISKKQFEELIAKNDFIEYDSHFGNYYGTAKSVIFEALKKNDAIKQIDMNGIIKLKNKSDFNSKNNILSFNGLSVKVYFVAILTPDIELTIKMLKNREGSNLDESRIKSIRKEYEFAKKNADFIVFNEFNKIKESAQKLKEVLYEIKNNS